MANYDRINHPKGTARDAYDGLHQSAPVSTVTTDYRLHRSQQTPPPRQIITPTRRPPGRKNYKTFPAEGYSSRDRSGTGPKKPRKRKSRVSLCLKYAIFGFNFFFWVCSLLVLAFGTYALVDKQKKIQDYIDFFFDPAIYLTISGGIIFVLSFLGCLGSLRENVCLLKMFYWFLAILLLIQIGAGVFLLLMKFVPDFQHNLGWKINGQLKLSLEKYQEDTDLQDFIDSIQLAFSCCGIDSAADWDTNIYYRCRNETDPFHPVQECGVPSSCCHPTETGLKPGVQCGFGSRSPNSIQQKKAIYTTGCVQAFSSWVDRNAVAIGAVSLAIILPELLAIGLSRKLTAQIYLQMAS